ncbi:MAG: hypothetical protein A2286_00300 [Gammaproteobacteria bacterium RIFOXYA12_FULL_61_12]|nr:MAG: hypothetical protein A2514_11280 [Gammaproteobacteria bacterium RIFOXYD12_FULL_61_37]OGT94032.1 MAG: hypothetical protein A2286_00300 [Gammaproteobacteria bacterium RIFOXYA12_FULL_61_12]
MLQITDLSALVSAIASASLLLSHAYVNIISARAKITADTKLTVRNSSKRRISDEDQHALSSPSESISWAAIAASWLFLLLSLATLALLQFGPEGSKTLATGDMVTITIAAMLFYQSHRVMN